MCELHCNSLNAASDNEIRRLNFIGIVLYLFPKILYFFVMGGDSSIWCGNQHLSTRLLGLTATTASPMAGYGRGHSFFLKMAMVAEF